MKSAMARLGDKWNRNQLYDRAIALGVIQPSRKYAKWTEEELMLVEKNAHKSPESIVKILVRNGFQKRTQAAVVLKLKRTLGGVVQARIDAGWMTQTQAALALGVAQKTISRYVDLDKCKEGPACGMNQSVLVPMAELRRLVINHPLTFINEKTDRYFLVDLLVPNHGSKTDKRKEDRDD